MKIGKDTITCTCSFIYSYNCALGALGPLHVGSTGGYPDKQKYAPYALDLAKEFLVFLKNPPGGVTTEGNWGTYKQDLAFYVFHDNVKGIGHAEVGNPLFDMSSFLEFMSQNEKELGVRIIKTPMVDNLWHTPKGHHPGRVFILIPPWAQIYEKGADVSAGEKKQLKDLVKNFGYAVLTKEDKETVKSLI